MILQTLRDNPPYHSQPNAPANAASANPNADDGFSEKESLTGTASDSRSLFLQGLCELGRHHYQHSTAYRNIIDGMWGGESALNVSRLEDVPYLPVSLFKTRLLSSIAPSAQLMTLTSSGTTGQAVSQIVIDKDTSTAQQACLANSMAHILGPKRLPMLVIDSKSVFSNPAKMSARGAGVLGMMRFGGRPAFALDEDMKPDPGAVEEFLSKFGQQPFFVFGFTFMVWTALYEVFKDAGFDLSEAILVHSGGWKKMEAQKVDNSVFRERLKSAFNIHQVYNFYGMVEQLGSIFLEGEDGLLHPPNFSDVIIRDPVTFAPCRDGEEGLIQVLSLIPRSYPGHSLLTEDIGVIESQECTGKIGGKGLRIVGRVPKAELRGCSDVIAAGSSQ